MKNFYTLSLLFLICLQTGNAQAQTEIFNYKQAISSRMRTLTVSINSINRTTGEVVFVGGDSRGPTTPGLFFTWIWGDGTSINGFFPQTKRYADVTKNYVVKVVSTYSATEKDTVEVLVDFVPGKVTPVPLDLKLKVYIPNQPFTVDGVPRIPFPDRIFSSEARAQLEYLLHVGSTIEYDFVNSDVRLTGGKFEQYMFRDSLFPGAYALSGSQPIAFGAGDVLTKGNVDYSSLYHEMGHNYTLNTPPDYSLNGRLGDRAFAFYGEAIAQIFQQAAGYELINNYQKYGIDEALLQKLKANFMVNARGQRATFDEYVKDGMPFSSWSKVPGYSYTDSKEAFITFIVVAYKFMETAEQQGKGYRMPMKRMMQFLRRFNADWVTRYDPQNDNARASAFRATLWAAAMSQAFQRDMRADFRAINFPVSDADWTYLNPALFDVSANALNLSATTGSVASFSVTSTAGSWSVVSSQPWLTVGSSTGSGDQTVTLTAAANTATASRTAVVTASSAGFLDRTITVTQAGAAATLITSAANLTVTATAATTSFSITANTSWTLTSSQPWLTTSPTSGSGASAITLTAGANTIPQSRTATVTVAGGGAAQTVTVVQAGAPPMLASSVSSLSVDAASTATSFSITSNTNWTVISAQPWLTISPASGSGNAVITLTIMANSLTDIRTATVNVTSGAIPQPVSVTQRGVLITALPIGFEREPLLYPNPVGSQLHLRDLPLNCIIRMYDVQGRLLQTSVSQGSTAVLATDLLNAGTYYLRIESNGQPIGRRFIK